MASFAVFPLAGLLPSTDSAAAVGPALFVCFLGTMRPSDSPAACALGGWSVTFPNRPASPIGEGTAWVSRFPCCEFPRMRRFSDSAASRQGLPKRPAACGLPLVRTRSAHGTDDFGAQWLACVYPCPCHTRDVAITSVGLGAEANG